jgi:prepilin-type N-terminal cleavage/methylation domain-containing protein/prepilin-type processing-associated H-X9-DG protein
MRKRQGFTLTELFVAIGAIAVLASLVVPVASKARSAANATSCLSNLRQMGAAFTMYEMENRSALVPCEWNTTSPKFIAYKNYWFGILDTYGVKSDILFCPSANAPLYQDPFSLAGKASRGFGSAFNCWTGRFGPNGTAITSTVPTPPPSNGGGVYRDGSYGYNRYLTAQFSGMGGFGPNGKGTSLLAVQYLGDVPAFMDCIFADVQPANGNPLLAPKLPKDLSGMSAVPGSPSAPPGGAPELWKLLIARHGTAINVCMADGSARLVPLSDLYTLTWNAGWQKYSLKIP